MAHLMEYLRFTARKTYGANGTSPSGICHNSKRASISTQGNMMAHEPEISPSGSPILRHAPREDGWQPASGDSALEAISNHIERHIGPIENVWHEIISDLVHIDVHHVPPRPERNVHTLVTSGMSDLPMTAPEGQEEFRYAELLLCLPPEWPVTQEAFQDETNYWPVRWLKTLARLPHEYKTWLGYGHTVPNGDPPQPFAPNTKLCCLMVMPPLTVDEEFYELRVSEEKTIHFWGLVPLYREEMNFKLRRGVEPLFPRFDKAGVSEIVLTDRPNTCRRSIWPF